MTYFPTESEFAVIYWILMKGQATWTDLKRATNSIISERGLTKVLGRLKDRELITQDSETNVYSMNKSWLRKNKTLTRIITVIAKHEETQLEIAAEQKQFQKWASPRLARKKDLTVEDSAEQLDSMVKSIMAVSVIGQSWDMLREVLRWRLEEQKSEENRGTRDTDSVRWGYGLAMMYVQRIEKAFRTIIMKALVDPDFADLLLSLPKSERLQSLSVMNAFIEHREREETADHPSEHEGIEPLPAKSGDET
jgi:hypothetical protein